MFTYESLEDAKTANATVTACWLSFSTMQKLLVETVDRELKERVGLNLDDYELLAFVNQAQDRRARMAEIAEAVISPKSRLTYQVDQLEKRGYLKRTTCPHDRRGLYAEVTEEGADVVERARPEYAKILRHNFTEPVGPDLLLEMLRVSNTIRRQLSRQALAVAQQPPERPVFLVEIDS